MDRFQSRTSSSKKSGKTQKVEIEVRTPDQKTFKVTITRSKTVRDLKVMIDTKFKIPVESQQLTLRGHGGHGSLRDDNCIGNICKDRVTYVDLSKKSVPAVEENKETGSGSSKSNECLYEGQKSTEKAMQSVGEWRFNCPDPQGKRTFKNQEASGESVQHVGDVHVNGQGH